jgi:hypothetical protein
LVLISVSALAGPAEFSKGSFYLTPQIGLNRWTIPFGVNAEYAVAPNIGVGATVMIWLWSDTEWTESVIAPVIEAAYHFTQLDVKKLDLYAGAGLGFAIYSWSWKAGESGAGATGSSSLFVEPFVGVRYYFTPKIAGSLKLGGTLGGGWGSVGGTLGVTFLLSK